jgi:superfamily II DNA or RNA helicase/HKD family nuclease/phage repressor protein C with HTH and peptisase S24 domain
MSTPGHNLVIGGEDHFLPKLIHAINHATRIDIAVSFIRSSGLVLIKDALEDALEADVKVRIITSGYLQITEPKALQMLMILLDKGAEVKIFESGDLAFHMKSYIFIQREDRFSKEGLAYVGSSNISQSALKHGLEWNLKISSSENAEGFKEVCDKFRRLFQDDRATPLTHKWIDTYKEQYQARTPFEKASGGVEVEKEKLQPISPNPIQLEALEKLHATRSEGYVRGLVVMATGTGKTWLSAFDCQATRSKKILFVAHRDEILSQSEETYVRIFDDAKIGKYTGTQKDEDVDILFASIQTLGKQTHIEKFEEDYFDYIIVDEFHHAGAKTYKRLLAHFSPKFLLGLTATPERTDQADILSLCDDNLVYENGIKEAIDREILCPFHYYGIADTIDYQEIAWRNGKFDPEDLSNQLATNARAEHSYKYWMDHKQERSLAFCCSIKHANFMAEFFGQKGIRAAAIHSESTVRRNEGLAQLKSGELEILFTVDLFNEGIDLPAIDTVLMLRPTESKIIFLQQLGRGLRVSHETEKEKLIVLDFIGNHISFFKKLEALFKIGVTNQNRRECLDKIKNDTIELPAGCFMNYDLEAINFLEQLVMTRSDAHVEIYRTLRESLGRRPTASEFRLAGGSKNQIRNEFGSWIDLLIHEGDLEGAALSAANAHKAFLSELEVTKLTKSYKLVLLESFLAMEGFNNPPLLSALSLRSWKDLNRRRPLLQDLPEKYHGNPEGDPQAESRWIDHWKRNPVNAWIGGNDPNNPIFFNVTNGIFQFNSEVQPQDLDALTDLTQELVNLRYLEYEERLNQMSSTPAESTDFQSEGSDIPFFTDLEIACGYFRASPHERESIELTQLPLKYGKLNPAKHFIARAKGESMNGGSNPIHDGDHLLLEAITPESAGSISNQIIAIETQSPAGDDQYLLRYVEKTGPGSYNLIATNPEYPIFKVNDSMRTFARLKEVIDPFDIHLHKQFMRADIPPLFGLDFNKGVWEQGHACPKPILDQILLVTLNKRNHIQDHRYHDYFMDPQTFHWQSQNRAAPNNNFGRKIINHVEDESPIHLFVRKHKLLNKTAAPFWYLGRVTIQSHSGAKPMNVIWDLEEALPEAIFSEFSM